MSFIKRYCRRVYKAVYKVYRIGTIDHCTLYFYIYFIKAVNFACSGLWNEKRIWLKRPKTKQK